MFDPLSSGRHTVFYENIYYDSLNQAGSRASPVIHSSWKQLFVDGLRLSEDFPGLDAE